MPRRRACSQPTPTTRCQTAAQRCSVAGVPHGLACRPRADATESYTSNGALARRAAPTSETQQSIQNSEYIWRTPPRAAWRWRRRAQQQQLRRQHQPRRHAIRVRARDQSQQPGRQQRQARRIRENGLGGKTTSAGRCAPPGRVLLGARASQQRRATLRCRHTAGRRLLIAAEGGHPRMLRAACAVRRMHGAPRARARQVRAVHA